LTFNFKSVAFQESIVYPIQTRNAFKQFIDDQGYYVIINESRHWNS